MNEEILSQFNEADVREEIMAPLLRRLEYQTGTENNIIREQHLRYNKSSLGRKNNQKDWPLRGKADYICEAKSLIRWTVETKPPDREISLDDIEQAYTYARHPEVRAVYFCLCNGRELRVYQTADAPTAEPLLCLKCEDIDNSFHAIKSLLSPDSIIKNHPKFVPDFGQPLGQNLKSLARITGGNIVLDRIQPNLPGFTGYTIFITEGAIQRDDSGCLTAFLDTLSPFEPLQKLNERLDLAKFEMQSSDSVFSVEDSKPTIFQSTKTMCLAKGERLYNFMTGDEVVLTSNLTCKCEVSAKGILKESVFIGDFQAKYDYLEFDTKISIDGKFEIHIA